MKENVGDDAEIVEGDVVKCGEPAQSPTAKTPSLGVSRLSLVSMKPFPVS